MIKVVYHHSVNGCLLEEAFETALEVPILPDAGDLVTLVDKDGNEVVRQQMAVDRTYKYDARTGDVTWEILVKRPE